jgi:transposase-like protein
MTGHLGYRALGNFAKYQQRHLTQYFRIRRRKLQLYSTIRRASVEVDWANLIEIFNQWASQLT